MSLSEYGALGILGLYIAVGLVVLFWDRWRHD